MVNQSDLHTMADDVSDCLYFSEKSMKKIMTISSQLLEVAHSNYDGVSEKYVLDKLIDLQSEYAVLSNACANYAKLIELRANAIAD